MIRITIKILSFVRLLLVTHYTTSAKTLKVVYSFLSCPADTQTNKGKNYLIGGSNNIKN